MFVVIMWDKSEIQGDSGGRLKIFGVGTNVIVRKTITMDMFHSEWSPRHVQNFLSLQIESIVSSNTDKKGDRGSSVVKVLCHKS